MDQQRQKPGADILEQTKKAIDVERARQVIGYLHENQIIPLSVNITYDNVSIVIAHTRKVDEIFKGACYRTQYGSYCNVYFYQTKLLGCLIKWKVKRRK